MEIFGEKKRNKGSRLLGGSAVQMCCLQGLGQFQILLHSKENLSEGPSSRSSPWIYYYFSFFLKLVIENNVKTSQRVRAEGCLIT